MELVKLKDQKVYDDWKAVNVDAYSNRIFTYAEDWAALMEARMEKGERLEDIAHETERQADTDGITGFMYGAAVAVLSHCWIHGEQLRIWHNLKTQIGNEGEEANKKGTVLNPALMSVKVKD